MGIPVVVIGKQHICPDKDGNKPHIGGAVTEGISGVFIDGMPVAVVGSKCICCSPKENSITSGACGVLVDGKPIAILGSQTEHGGNVIEGIAGVTISGGFATQSDEPEDFEPQIFNLQWKRNEQITDWGLATEKVILSADAIGYEEGEEVIIKVFNENEDGLIEEVKGIVQNNRIEVEWEVKTNEETNQ